MVKVVYYDLETTNLRPLTGPRGVEIVQIGAVCKQTRNKTQNKFNMYLVPDQDISPGATRINGLTRDDLVEDFDSGRFNNVVEPQEGLQEFMNFLDNQRDYDDEGILLVS